MLCQLFFVTREGNFQAVSKLVKKYQFQWKRKEWYMRRERDLGHTVYVVFFE